MEVSKMSLGATLNMKEIQGMKFYDVDDLVEILDLTKLTVRNYIRKGKIKGKRIGKKYYVNQEQLTDFLKSSDDYMKFDEEGNPAEKTD